MAGESSTGFHIHQHHQRGMAFNPMRNSDAVSSGCELISIGNYFNTHVGSLNLCSLETPGTSLGLKHDTGLAVEWSVEEQYKLDEGLAKYANEPNILRYIKISASLRDKTVRDVALRCRWMTRKRRKQQDASLAKNDQDWKENLAGSCLKNNISSPLSIPVIPYSLMANHHDHVLCRTSRHLLEDNIQALGQISANLSTLKLQQNIDLFIRTRNNLTTILNDMKNAPGIISRMPPLPVLFNDELVNCVFLHSTQSMASGLSNMAPLKHEPEC